MKKLLTVFKNLILVTLPTLIVLFIILELFFRFAIPAAEWPFRYFDKGDAIYKLDKRKKERGVYTIGKFAQQKARWRVNNFGWNSEIDYHRESKVPLIAIIGDSYIEALQVDIGKNIASHIREKVKEKYRVYSFGISGAPLSQYLEMARYVSRTFNPEILIINIVHNDFHKSIVSNASKAGMVYLRMNGKVIVEEKVPYDKKTVRARDVAWLLRYSSVVRYFYMNLQASHVVSMNTLKKIFSPGEVKKEKYNANVDVRGVGMKRASIERATSYLVKKFRNENKKRKILFVIDALRKDIYSRSLPKSNLSWMNRLLIGECRKMKIKCIDLTGPFDKLFNKNGKRFEFRNDGHWNEYGHKSAAEIVYGNLLKFKFLNK